MKFYSGFYRSVFFSCILVALLTSPVIASEIQPKASLSDALFYAQLSNPQAQSNVVHVSRKNPWAAGVLSFLVPGLGQVYNGEPVKGFAFFTGTVAGYTLLYLANEDNYSGGFLGLQTVDPDGDDTIGTIGGASVMGLWITSIVDAARSANRINRQRFSASPLIKPKHVGATFTLRW